MYDEALCQPNVLEEVKKDLEKDLMGMNCMLRDPALFAAREISDVPWLE